MSNDTKKLNDSGQHPFAEVTCYAARGIHETSWLQDPRFVWFKSGHEYASTQTSAIPALSKCTPEELYYAVCAVLRGARIPIPDEAA